MKKTEKNKNMYHNKEFGKRNGRVPDRMHLNSLLNIMLMFITLLSFTTLFATQVYAISGSGGTINLNSEIGSLSYNGIGSGTNSYGGSSTIYGEFSVGSFSGGLGLLGGEGSLTANLSIISPSSGVVIIGTNAYFNYIPSGDINNCSLYFDGSLRGFNSNPTMNSVNLFIVDSLSIGKHFWSINCSYGKYSLAESREFTTIMVAGLDVNSTYLATINASAVPNLTVSKSEGRIVFGGYTDISNGIDLSANVRISSRSIYVNSAAVPMLNKPATLTLNDIPFNNVVIWRDGAVCNDCSILSLSGSKLVFSVTGFSEYTITSTSKLATYDDSDFKGILQNQTMTFNANYTNITSGDSITGSCNIILPDGTHAMTYNATSATYQYTSSFETKGVQPYTVQCTPSESGFDALNVDATFAVSTPPPKTFANLNVSQGPTSSMNISNDASIIYAEADNVTELAFDAQTVTKTWQGYYGNVVGNVTLSDTNSHSLYNWELVSPNGEIYATRSPSVNWETVRCANLVELQAENTVLGVSEAADDSVTNTFRNASSFNKFYTGTIQINSSQNCYATHLNDNSGIQSEHYAELLLSDSTLMIYTTLLDPNAIGFDGNKYNFEMLVGQNGHTGDTTPTMYYFYIEIG